jgi:hypothetical protein
MSDKSALFVAWMLGVCVGFGIGGLVATSPNPQDDQLKHYRAVLIRNGIAEYRADENGEPIFVITHKEDGNKPTDR